MSTRPTCDFCRAPIVGKGYLGRPWPDRAAAMYCCYGCLSLGEQDRLEAQAAAGSGRRFDGFAIRIGIGILIAGQSMIFGLAVSLEEKTPPLVKQIVQGTVLAGTMLVMFLLGGPLLRNAWNEFRQRRLSMEALFLLTLAGAMFASLQSFITGHGPIYFEVVSVLLVVYSLGKAIGARSRAAAIASTRLWASSLNTCRLVDERGRDRIVNVATILPGDSIEVRPGETIAVDGTIREGMGFVSEAAVSGEPFAVVRRPGDRVLAGMACYDATLRIEATAPGSARQIDHLLRAVEDARAHPISVQAQADRIGAVFFPLLVFIAGITFVAWTAIAGWQTGLFNAMSVLLVACPCALGLATPIVIWSALSRLAERGIVAHAGDVIERLARVDSVIFDKTGTLTEDAYSLIDIVTIPQGEERARLLGWLSLVEEQSQHPIARPFAALPRPFADHEVPRIHAFNVVPGCGVEAIVEERQRKHTIRIGRPEWLESAKRPEEAALRQQLIADHGHRIDCECDGQLVAIAVVSERLRDSTAEALRSVQAMNLPITVITGDTPQRAATLGIADTHAGLLPEDKRRWIHDRIAAGARPLMIGDGINDAGALATAYASMALSSGTEIANQAASATIYGGDLRVIPWAIALSREATLAIRRNLWRALAYNILGVALAAFGVLHPIAAALLMLVSSLLVTWSSARIGVPAEVHCDNPDLLAASPPTPPASNETSTKINPIPWSTIAKGSLHGLCFALQGIAILLLLRLSTASSSVVIAGMVIGGLLLSYVWCRWAQMPHGVNMALGMLTLGNLGMLVGWWADMGFTHLHTGCCQCVQAMKDGLFRPWMWVGMLLLANVAMAWLGRQPHPDLPYCRTAMYTGGNLGMVLGMFFGGWLGAQLATESVPWSFSASFLGMTFGMIAGMHLGYEITRRGLWWLYRLRLLPGWLLRLGTMPPGR